MSWSGSAKFLLALTVATGLAAPPEARAADAPFRHAAQVASPVKMDVSPALRTITPIQGVTEGKKAPENPPIAKQSRPLGQAGSATGPDAALQQRPGLLNMPAPAVNFEGINNVWGYYPPDTTGDVGPNHFVQWVNVGFAVYDKTGTKVYPAGAGFANGNTLWSGFGGACETSQRRRPAGELRPPGGPLGHVAVRAAQLSLGSLLPVLRGLPDPGSDRCLVSLCLRRQRDEDERLPEDRRLAGRLLHDRQPVHRRLLLGRPRRLRLRA